MNRRGFFGRIAGFLGIPVFLRAPAGRPLRDGGPGEMSVTWGSGAVQWYWVGDSPPASCGLLVDLGHITLADGCKQRLFAFDKGDSDE